MRFNVGIPRKIVAAYGNFCKPLCKELGLTQTAFDILMFLGNNPEYKTASEIVEIRRIKANLVSMNVDRLVQESYLNRRSVQGDRRKTDLICTEKAERVIEQGRQVQEAFSQRLFADMDADTRTAFIRAMETLETTLNVMLEEESSCGKY